jgi:two-component system CheB/CheR fusion protein
VVDTDMRVLTWNNGAEELWGVRADEAVGSHLTNLDIGLPVEQLRQTIDSQLDSADTAPQTLVLDAVNRRGRRVQVRIKIATIHDHGGPSPAVVILMDTRPDAS